MGKGYIHRDKHDKNYTCISNSVLFDERLTDTAAVLVSRILSIDDSKWDWSKEGLRIKVNMKEHAFNSAFKLLRELGYIVLKESRKANGQNSYEWHIYENPYMEEQPHDNQGVASQVQLSNNYISNKELNTDVLNINQSIDEGRLMEIEKNFRKQIEFEILEQRFASKSPVERKIMHELVDLAIDVLQSNTPTYRIGREEKPRVVVESCLKKLTCENIEQTADNVFRYENPIKNSESFMLTALYKSIFTMGTQSNAKVNAEIAG